MAGVATPAVLDRYAEKFKERVSQYPWAWSLSVISDTRCRQEYWPQELRRQVDFHAAHPSMSGFNPDMPWNGVIRRATEDEGFWMRELERPAMLARMGGSRSLASAGSSGSLGGAVAFTSSRERTVEARLAEEGRPAAGSDGGCEGPSRRAQVCWLWNRSANGCAATCPARRTHQCELCHGAHRAVQCAANPGWVPPKGGGGKSRGGKPSS